MSIEGLFAAFFSSLVVLAKQIHKETSDLQYEQANIWRFVGAERVI